MSLLRQFPYRGQEIDSGALKKIMSISQGIMSDLDVFQGCLLESGLLELVNTNIYHALRELLPNTEIDQD